MYSHVVKDFPEEGLQEDKGSLVPGTPFPFLALHVGKSKKGEGEPGMRLGQGYPNIIHKDLHVYACQD